MGLIITPDSLAALAGAASLKILTSDGTTWVASAYSISGVSGKTLTFNKSLTLEGTDSTTMTFPSTSATIARTDAANAFTGHQTIEGVTSTGATGTGKLVFDDSPTISGHPTVEGTTSTGATGSGGFVFSTSPSLTTPILGTPTSGTLTNCTGLTVAGITSSTSTALGVGSLEVGHASDSTLNRVGAGQLAVEVADVIPATFMLTADGSAIGPTIADFFGAGSAYPTVTNARYIIHCEIFYTKTTAGTVTFTMTNSQAYTNIAMKFLGSPAGGMGVFNNCAEIGIDNTTTAGAALPATGSLTNATEHQASIWAIAEVGTSGTIKLQVTSGAGTVTPRRGCYMQVTRLPAGNVGGWA